jgi:hypothetical protein
MPACTTLEALMLRRWRENVTEHVGAGAKGWR